MLYTTFKLAKEAGAGPSSYRRYARHVGGVKKYGVLSPIPLTDVTRVCGILDALWGLQCTTEPVEAERLGQSLAADFAEHVLPIWEKYYPADPRPRQAIEATRLYLDGEITEATRAGAGAAAGAAAGEATRPGAGAAAWVAALAAAGAGELEWQKQHFIEVLER